MEDIKFITLTNDGYLDYTLNLIKSLQNINFDVNRLTCYCIGHKSYTVLKNILKNVIRIQSNAKDFKEYGSNTWGDVLKYKTYIIQQNLKKYKYVCITDGDIVYENNKFLEYCLNGLNNNEADMICQAGNKDIVASSEDCVCCGFMFIKSSDKTLKLFDFNCCNMDVTSTWKEQPYINNKIKTLGINVTLLDKLLFPNGYIYYNHTDKIINPYLIHFNWVIGDEKKTLMKKYKKWYNNK